MAVTSRTDAERLTRLEDGLADMQKTVSSLAESVRESHQGLSNSVESLAKSFQTSRQWSWQWIFGAIAAFAVIISLATNYFVNPVNKEVAAIEVHLQATDASLDRIRTASGKNTGDIATMQAEFEERMMEVETQICAEDMMRNLMHANDLRVQALLMKHGGEEYPVGNAYYPEICQRHPFDGKR